MQNRGGREAFGAFRASTMQASSIHHASSVRPPCKLRPSTMQAPSVHHASIVRPPCLLAARSMVGLGAEKYSPGLLQGGFSPFKPALKKREEGISVQEEAHFSLFQMLGFRYPPVWQPIVSFRFRFSELAGEKAETKDCSALEKSKCQNVREGFTAAESAKRCESASKKPPATDISCYPRARVTRKFTDCVSSFSVSFHIIRA